jgi:secondary thiamine-phosphate synthase enzyme
MDVISVSTSSREEFVDISSDVQDIASQYETIKTVVVYCPHTTAGLTINENADPDVVKDILKHLRKIVPNEGFAHSEGNSDAHIKASLMGSSLTIPVNDGKLDLGTWQGIYFCEFDGPRNRKVHVKVI